MSRNKPTPAQAQLHLQLYDLRREPKLREARQWFLQNFFAEAPEDWQRLAPPGSQQDAFVRMVLSHWDQACLLLAYGLLHEELFFKTTNEFFLVWERIKALAPAFRAWLKNPHMQENLERASLRYEKWAQRQAPGYIEVIREWSRAQAGAA